MLTGLHALQSCIDRFARTAVVHWQVWFQCSNALSSFAVMRWQVGWNAGAIDAGDGGAAWCGSSNQCYHDPVHFCISLPCLPQLWRHRVSTTIWQWSLFAWCTLFWRACSRCSRRSMSADSCGLQLCVWCNLKLMHSSLCMQYSWPLSK